MSNRLSLRGHTNVMKKVFFVLLFTALLIVTSCHLTFKIESIYVFCYFLVSFFSNIAFIAHYLNENDIHE